MRIAGIIAEYDPFHKGHAAHIAATRDENGGNASHIVTVISGNFTQRGEPALISKFHRAEMALAGGADLVLELPLPWAMAPAENFALGGVSILKALGCVDLISFGSECGDSDMLKQVAALPQNPQYQSILREALASGIPYAAAGQIAASKLLGDEVASVLASPNNTLGIEYLRANKKLCADFDVFTLLRQGTLHNELQANQGFASASLIRRGIIEGNWDVLSYVPDSTAEVLNTAIKQGNAPSNKAVLEQSLLPLLRRMNNEDFARLPWMSEGLENRLYSVSRTAQTYEELLTALKTKRYPLARLRRILWAALIGMSNEDTTGLPPYIRVLAMNQRGQEILAAAKPNLPLISRTSQVNDLDERAKRIFALECVATDLHALTFPTPQPCGTDHTQKLIVTA